MLHRLKNIFIKQFKNITKKPLKVHTKKFNNNKKIDFTTNSPFGPILARMECIWRRISSDSKISWLADCLSNPNNTVVTLWFTITKARLLPAVMMPRFHNLNNKEDGAVQACTLYMYFWCSFSQNKKRGRETAWKRWPDWWKSNGQVMVPCK